MPGTKKRRQSDNAQPGVEAERTGVGEGALRNSRVLKRIALASIPFFRGRRSPRRTSSLITRTFFSLVLVVSFCLPQDVAPAFAASNAPGKVAPLVSRQISEKKPDPKYAIEVRYPQIADAKESKHQNFNREVAVLARKQAEEFKKHVAKPEPGMPGADAGSSLDISYSVGVSNDRVISVGFEADTYYAGAAHPNHHTFVYNYDLRQGRRLDLGDLFEPRSTYLKVIAEYCVEVLAKQVAQPPDMSEIARGAAPTAQNYQSWMITSQGLKFTFDPYQVASYAEGPQEVVVPYRALKGLIGAESPIAKLAD